MNRFLCSSLVYVLISKFIPFIEADCQLSDPTDIHSSKLLNQIEPLKGAKFENTYLDEVVEEKYKYTLTICAGIETADFQSNEVGVIQQKLLNDNTGAEFTKVVGRINSTIIKGGTDWIMLTYAQGDMYKSHCNKGARQAHLMIVCDPTTLKGEFKVLYEHNTEDDESGCFYMMELSSSVACNDLPNGLSSGTIFLIVFFSFSTVYLLCGILYKRYAYGTKGWDQIPNIGFWKSLGSLQADGCNFLCRCSQSGYKSDEPYKGVADDQLDEEIDEHLLPM